MEGPHNTHAWSGYDAIPDKGQAEPIYGPSNIWPWPEPAWEGPMHAIFAVTSVVFEGAAKPTNNNLDMARWGRETMHPRNYMNAPYFELWLRSVSRYLQRSGKATTEELTLPRGVHGPIVDVASLNRAIAIENSAKTEATPGFGFPVSQQSHGGQTYPVYSSTEYQEETPPIAPKFKVGDRVRAILLRTDSHSRHYPLYRNKIGTVVAYYGLAKPVQGTFQPYYQSPYPDVNCKGLQNYLVPLYSVRFESSAVWGPQFVERGVGNNSRTMIYADMWEPYLRRIGPLVVDN
ncbi:MAG: SH3-like domain-containing protein [Candidatus Methylumidiphilus sp.]